MIETKRLFIRPFELTDAPEAFEWFGNNEVMKFIPNGPDKCITETEQRIAKYIQFYKTYGFSKYVIINKINGKLIGDCGILPIENMELKELGYRITRILWRNGYATEAAIGVLSYAFNILKFNEIHAIVETGNTISINMITNKLGFNYINEIECYDSIFRLYNLQAIDFKNCVIA